MNGVFDGQEQAGNSDKLPLGWPHPAVLAYLQPIRHAQVAVLVRDFCVVPDGALTNIVTFALQYNT